MNKQLLDIYSDYLIAQNQYATATGLSDLLEGQISHDKITRFLNKEVLCWGLGSNGTVNPLKDTNMTIN